MKNNPFEEDDFDDEPEGLFLVGSVSDQTDFDDFDEFHNLNDGWLNTDSDTDPFGFHSEED
jgi:hypothetical protein